jgi:hypothetical protein
MSSSTPLTPNNEMLRPKRVKNGTDGAGRISAILVAGWLIFVWSCPAFSDEQRHLQLAPILFTTRVNGNINYAYLRNDFGASGNSMQTLGVIVSANARARSFFWQPWFAQISGDLGAIINSSRTNYSTPNSGSAGNALIMGNAYLDLLKYSRFPFMAHVFRNGNHASGTTSGINSDYLSNGYELTQRYRTFRGNLDGVVIYSHNGMGRANFGTEDARDQWNFNVSVLPAKGQTLELNGNFNNTNHPLAGTSSYTDLLTANHLYQPNSAFSIATMGNVIRSGYTMPPGISVQQQNEYNSQQLSSFAAWRPIGSPLTVTSSVRLLKTQIGNFATNFDYDNTNFNFGANYAWSRFLRMYGSVNVNDSGGIQTISTNAALSASKMFGDTDVITLGGFRYSRYASAGVSTSSITTNNSNSFTTTNSPASGTRSTQSLTGNLGHQLTKSTNYGNGNLTIDMNQRLSELLSTRSTYSSAQSHFSNLTTSGSVTWTRSEGRATTNIRLHATDSRALTGMQNFFDLINLQASRNVHLVRHQSLTGDMTLQTSRSGSYGQSTPFITTPSVHLSYDNQRVFAVKNLTFISRIEIVGAEIGASGYSWSNSPVNMMTNSWDNDLNYFIGKFRLRLYSHLAKVNNLTQSTLLYTMERQF